MAVSLPGLFTNRLRMLIKAARNLNGYRNTVAPYPDPATLWGASGPTIYDLETALENIAAGYNATDFEYLIDGLQADATAHRAAQKTFLTKLAAYAKSTVIAMTDADTPLSAKTIAVALAELIRQMKSSSDSVNASEPAVTVATDSGNTGDAVCAATVKDVYGKNSEHVLAETIVLTATSDEGLGATLASEPWTAKGEAAESDTLSHLWPAGSGASKALTALDAGGSSNLLTNGDFDTFTVANTPTSWTIQVGAAGTDIFDGGSSQDYQGDKCLKFTGTGGSPLSQIWQLVELEPNTIYGVCFRAKDSGAGLLAGVLSIDLYDPTAAAVVNDDAGTANSITKAFGTLTASYVGYTGFFITPKVLPTTIRLRVHISTALTSTESVYVDHLVIAEATQLYTGGPFAAVFSGATGTVKNDRFTLALTNTQGVYQEWFERMFGMRALGLQLPSNAGGSETVTDPT